MASSQAPASADNVDLDPIYEWLDNGDSYLLRLDLPEGFKKEDFRVQVDGEGRLTVIGQRRPPPGDGKAVRLNKVFQLPSTANLDAVSGRFDGTVLSLRVPKLPQTAAAGDAAEPLPPPPPPPPPMMPPPMYGPHDRMMPPRHRPHGPPMMHGPMTPPPPPEPPARGNEEDAKAKPVAPAPPPQATEKARGDDHVEKASQEEKARAEHREKVAQEAARRVEAARARVAEAKAKAERERQCEQWKERAMEEGLKLADAVNRNKEVIATAVAAFTFGVFLSSKLFSRS